MATRSVKRNGRGQIVSYELSGYDSTNETPTYGSVVLSNDNSQMVDKYNLVSFRANVDSQITEFVTNPEYESATINFTLNLPFFNTNNVNVSTTTKAFIDANPNIDLGHIASLQG